METKFLPHVLELNGAHRGGREFAIELENLLSASPRSIKVQVVDPHPGRAESLAENLRASGISASPSAARASTKSRAPARVVVIDDARQTARLLENSGSTPHFQTGLVVAAPTLGPLGGGSFGISTTVSPGRSPAREGSQAVFDRIQELSPTRETSTHVSGPILSARSTRTARCEMDAALANRTMSYFDGERVASELRVVDGADGSAYAMRVISTPPRTRRRDLKMLTLNELLPNDPDPGQHQGVFFTEDSDPRLFLVLARFDAIRERWRIHKTVDLPTPAPPELRLEFSADTTPGILPGRAGESRTRPTDRPSRLFVTD